MAAAHEVPILEQRLAIAQSESLESNLARWHAFAGEPEWIELQALKIRGDRSAFTISRYAHADTVASASRLAAIADKFSCPAVYLIANPIDAAVATRDVPGQWRDMGKGDATTDGEIATRTSVYIDIDAVRVKGTSATSEELAHAFRIAQRLHVDLGTMLEGDDAIGVGHSGNGVAIFLATDSLSLLAGGQRHEALLIALDARYSDANAKIDRSVHDAKRLVPCWGTMKRKGAPNIEARPHRRTSFVCSSGLCRLTLAQLDMVIATMRDGLPDAAQVLIDKALGVKVAAPPRRESTPARGDTQDLFKRANECPVADVLFWLGLFIGDVAQCPGCGLSDSGVAIVGNGLKCSHNRCQGKGVRDGFRTVVDLVVEQRRCSPIDAVRELGARFGFEVPSRPTIARPSVEPPEGRFDEDAPDFEPPVEHVIEPVRITMVTEPMTGRELAKPLPALQYLVRGLGMPSGAGAPHCFGGFGFSGKTVAAQSMLLSLAAGRAIWRAFTGPGKPQRVTHVDNEQGIALTQRRYQRLARNLGIDLESLGDLLRVLVFPKLSTGSRMMLVEEHRAFWQELMSERDVLLVDSFAASRDGVVSENDAAVRRAIDMLGELSEETKCRAQIIHHANKGNDEDPHGQERDARFSLRGSGSIFDACDSAYMLSGAKGEAVKLQHIKARSHGEPVDDIALVIEDIDKPEEEPIEADQDPKRWGLSLHVAGIELIEEQRDAKAEVKQDALKARHVARIRKALAGGVSVKVGTLKDITRLSGADFGRAWKVLEDLGEGSVESIKDGRNWLKMHSLRGGKT